MIIKILNNVHVFNVSKLAFDVEHMHVITRFLVGREIERRKHCVQL